MFPPQSRQAGWAKLVLTLDVDGDRSLLPSWDGFVGGSAHDTLPILHIARGDEEGTHDALTLAISQQGLGERGEKAPCHLAGLAWAGRGRHVPASEKKKETSAQDSQGCKSLQRAGGLLVAPWPGRALGCRRTEELEGLPSCGRISLGEALGLQVHTAGEAVSPQGNRVTCRRGCILGHGGKGRAGLGYR